MLTPASALRDRYSIRSAGFGNWERSPECWEASFLEFQIAGSQFNARSNKVNREPSGSTCESEKIVRRKPLNGRTYSPV